MQLYVHWWDFTTSIPEMMHALNNFVVSGKVLYLGISDTPAWIVSKANECKHPLLLLSSLPMAMLHFGVLRSPILHHRRS